MTRILILTALMISFVILAKPQDLQSAEKAERKTRNKYLSLGTGFTHINFIDHATSPLFYKGWTFPAAHLGYQVHSQKVIKSFEGDFCFGYLNSDTETPWYNPSYTSYYLVFRYNQLYRVTSMIHERVSFYLGPEINANGHLRVNYKYGNSAFTFDNYYGAGFAARFEFPFSYKARKVKVWFMQFSRRDRNLQLNWQFSMPVASFIIRPSYVTITNFIDPELQRKITADHTGGGFLIPLNIRSQTELYYFLKNSNAVRLSYVWNFYHHDPGYNRTQSAYHGILVALIFKFNP